MKKYLILLLVVSLLKNVSGQTYEIKAVYTRVGERDTLNYQLKPTMFDALFPLDSVAQSFNVLLMKVPYGSITGDKSMYHAFYENNWTPFYDTHQNNAFKKINDTAYEVHVNNPAKEVYFVRSYNSYKQEGPQFELVRDKNRGGLFGQDGIGKLQMRRDSIHVIANGKKTKYVLLNYAYANGQTIYLLDSTRRKRLLSIRIVMHFSKPAIERVSLDSNDIQKKLLNLSATFGDVDNMEKKEPKIPLTFNKTDTNILIVFKHFGGYSRLNDGDYLLYRIDNGNWRSMATSATPSILLENLPSGKHVLEVKYPDDQADILHYNFEILPN